MKKRKKWLQNLFIWILKLVLWSYWTGSLLGFWVDSFVVFVVGVDFDISFWFHVYRSLLLTSWVCSFIAGMAWIAVWCKGTSHYLVFSFLFFIVFKNYNSVAYIINIFRNKIKDVNIILFNITIIPSIDITCIGLYGALKHTATLYMMQCRHINNHARRLRLEKLLYLVLVLSRSPNGHLKP